MYHPQMTDKHDWRDFSFYPTDAPCCICGSTENTGIEPRFAYVVCETHSKLSPQAVSKIQNKA